MDRFLFIAVHPDDETLGCGGTILRCADEGHEIFWMILTSVREGNQWSKEFIAKRKGQIKDISTKYGFKEVIELEYATTTLDSIPASDFIANIASAINYIKPTTIFIPNKSDVHSDHRQSFKAIFSACKNFRAPYIERIFMYECLSETEYAPPFEGSTFVPNTWINITSFMDKKIEALSIYESEVLQAPFPRSPEVIQALASYRGSRIGVKYAEAFTLIFNTQL